MSDMVDKLGNRLGVERASARRLRAGIEQALSVAELRKERGIGAGANLAITQGQLRKLLEVDKEARDD